MKVQQPTIIDAQFEEVPLPSDSAARGMRVSTGPTKIIHASELERLCQQLLDLRDALQPFADFAEALPPIISGQPRLTDSGPAFTTAPLGKNHVITFAQLRKAKALLDVLEAEDTTRFIDQAEMAMGSVVCGGCDKPFMPDEASRFNEVDGKLFCKPSCLEFYQNIVALRGQELGATTTNRKP